VTVPRRHASRISYFLLCSSHGSRCRCRSARNPTTRNRHTFVSDYRSKPAWTTFRTPGRWSGRNDRSTVSKVRQIHTIEKRQSVRVDVLHNRGLIFERGSEFGVDGDTIQVADRIRHLADTIPTRPRPRRHIHCCFPAGSRTETRDETVSEHRLDSLHEFRKGVLCHNLPAHTLKRHPATGLHRKIPHLWRETQVASHGR